MDDDEDPIHRVYGPVRRTQWGIRFGTPGNIPDPDREPPKAPTTQIALGVVGVLVVTALVVVVALLLV